ncbi:hypothetical protein ACLI5Y_15635 [Enterococcus innesii]|uniref:hypothetical protein n=1 Tax=Enterococcus innesii TaxID=2839759 RepID=UPI0022B9B2BB|nr:hypothetical protein [Enterococcus innesii]
MKEIEKIGIKTSNKQPVKEISYQDMYRLGDTLEQLRSWQEPLCVLEKFFSDKKRPANKQKIIRDYHAYSLLFNVFLTDFGSSLEKMERQIGELKTRRKV